MKLQSSHFAEYITYRRNGDSSVLLDIDYFTEKIKNAYLCHHLAETIRKEKSIEVLTVVPTEGSVMLLFSQPVKQIETIIEAILTLFRQCLDNAKQFKTQSSLIELAVCYESPFAPDMSLVCKLTGLTEKEIIKRHSTPVYVISMLGFLPGFAYMLGLDERLLIPRKQTPNVNIQSGSVAIAAEYTGIYPTSSPGGWYCIGRTPVSLFDTEQCTPNELNPFDRISFKPVSYAEFIRLQPVN